MNEFICYNCKKNQNLTNLAGRIMRNAELLEQEKRDKENELIKLITLLSDIEDMGRLSEVGQEIRKLQGEIKNLCNKIGNKKEICQSC